MNRNRTKIGRRAVSWTLAAVAGLTLAFSVVARSAKTAGTPAPTRAAAASATVVKDGEYTSKDDVALYIRTYKGALPRNFITKREARALPRGVRAGRNASCSRRRASASTTPKTTTGLSRS